LPEQMGYRRQHDRKDHPATQDAEEPERQNSPNRGAHAAEMKHPSLAVNRHRDRCASHHVITPCRKIGALPVSECSPLATSLETPKLGPQVAIGQLFSEETKQRAEQPSLFQRCGDSNRAPTVRCGEDMTAGSDNPRTARRPGEGLASYHLGHLPHGRRKARLSNPST
jgi:hypothetical protein